MNMQQAREMKHQPPEVRAIFPMRVTQILDVWLVEMVISTNHISKIWVSRFDNYGLGGGGAGGGGQNMVVSC